MVIPLRGIWNYSSGVNKKGVVTMKVIRNGQILMGEAGSLKAGNIIDPVYNIGDADTTLEIDLANGATQKVNFTGVTTVTIIGWPSSGNYKQLKLYATRDTYSDTITWPDAEVHEITDGGEDLLILHSRDGGSTIGIVTAAYNI